MKKIFIFGDSIPLGRGISSDKSWPVLLSTSFNHIEQRGILIYNLSVAGNTSKDLLQRINFELSTRGVDDQSVIVLQVGINDAKNIKNINKNQISLIDFQKNIQKIISTSKKFTKRIICIGLSPVDEKRSFQKNLHYFRNADNKRYNKKLAEICQKEDVDFIEILSNWQKIDYRRYLLSDGIHLNKIGQYAIYKLVSEKINGYLP